LIQPSRASPRSSAAGAVSAGPQGDHPARGEEAERDRGAAAADDAEPDVADRDHPDRDVADRDEAARDVADRDHAGDDVADDEEAVGEVASVEPAGAGRFHPPDRSATPPAP
jgi:hypothetical protein